MMTSSTFCREGSVRSKGLGNVHTQLEMCRICLVGWGKVRSEASNSIELLNWHERGHLAFEARTGIWIVTNMTHIH